MIELYQWATLAFIAIILPIGCYFGFRTLFEAARMLWQLRGKGE